ncbi:hypothetical protein Pelo_9184 [Pelomyxa schiedti]|nr:hypothetical protein Pelo_9184 [Pelomyxa schiedti]
MSPMVWGPQLMTLQQEQGGGGGEGEGEEQGGGEGGDEEEDEGDVVAGLFDSGDRDASEAKGSAAASAASNSASSSGGSSSSGVSDSNPGGGIGSQGSGSALASSSSSNSLSNSASSSSLQSGSQTLGNGAITLAWGDGGGVGEDTLVRSLYFVAMFAPFNPLDSTFKNVMDRWVEVSSLSSMTVFSQRVNVLLLIGDTNNPLWDWVSDCVGVKLTRRISIELKKTCSACKYLALPYIRNQLCKQSTWQSIVNGIIALLVPEILVKGSRLLALLHLVRIILHSCPFIDGVTAASIADALKLCYAMQNPYSKLASELLHILAMEESIPGTYMRNFFFQEAPQILSNTSSQMEQNDTDVLIEGKNGWAVGIRDMSSFWQPWSPSPHEIRCSILANLLSRVLKIDTDLLGLSHCLMADVDRFFTEAVEITQKAESMPPNHAKQFCFVKLNHLKDKIFGCMNVGQAFKPPLLQYMLPPPLSFKFWDITCSESPPTIPAKAPSSPSVPTSTASINSQQDAIKSHPCFQILKTKLSLTQMKAVRVGVIGTDALIFTVLNSYLLLRQQCNSLFSDKDIIFYLLPAPESFYCQLLCEQDAWYCRYVVGMCKGMMEILPVFPPLPRGKRVETLEDSPIRPAPKPTLQDNIEAPDAEDLRHGPQTAFIGSKIANPASLVRSTLENFFREATYALNIPILVCQCESPHQPCYTHPFLKSCSIITPGSVSHSSRGKNTSFFTVELKYAIVDLSGVVKQTMTESLRVNSAEMKQDIGCTEHLMLLQLHCDPSDVKRARRGTSIPVAWVEISSERNFDVILDGQLRGSCTKIKVAFTEIVFSTRLFLPPPSW